MAVSSAIGLQSATQAAFQQLKLQQARQNAGRAEQVARQLQVEAAEAQRSAVQAQDNARDLSVRSGQAQGEAGRARQGLAMIRSVNSMKEGLSTVMDRVASPSRTDGEVKPPASTPVVSTAPAVSPAPVINTSGQVTGTVVNTVA